jgi:hypothetical protein
MGTITNTKLFFLKYCEISIIYKERKGQMKKNILMIVGVIFLSIFLSACSNQKATTPESTPATEKHEDGSAHTEGDSHQDESKPHVDATPHASPQASASPTTDAKDDSGRKPASVGDHKDEVPHGEDEPHN